MCFHDDPVLDRPRTTSAPTTASSSTTFTAENEVGDDVTYDLAKVPSDLKDAVLRAVIRKADSLDCLDGDDKYPDYGNCLELSLRGAARNRAAGASIDQLMALYVRYLIEELGQSHAARGAFEAVHDGLARGVSPKELRQELETLWNKSIEIGYVFPQVKGYEESKRD